MNKLLIDTHALIWFLRGDSDLSSTAKDVILDAEYEKLISIASLWEIAIKVNLAKIQFDFAFEDFSPLLQANQINILSVELDHLLIIGKLPLHHRDPFDRMLIAQALSEGLTIVTRDPHFEGYGVNVLW
jgi:PIN domain nuclease of toxin-antitoxin system